MDTSGPNSWVLVVAPQRSLATELVADLRPVSRVKGISVEILAPDSGLKTHKGKRIIVATAPSVLSALTKLRDDNGSRALGGLRLVICENLELLNASYELAISALLHATQTQPTRFFGLSNSLNDAADLAAWLNVPPLGLHSFRASDRDQSLTMSTQTFNIPQSAALFKAMSKPAHSAIATTPGEHAIVFIPSRGQCRPIARDLITQCVLESETDKGYLLDGVDPYHLEHLMTKIEDVSLVEFMTRGIGFYYEGMTRSDRTRTLELYADGIIRVLIVPHDSCWTLPVRAATVVVMGTQYLHLASGGDERQLRDYRLEELVHMQGRGVRHHGNGGHFYLFCQAEAKDTITRFLHDGLPLESQLLENSDLKRWYKARKQAGDIRNRQDGVDALSFTFLARRVMSNPIYYDASTGSRDDVLSRIVDTLESDNT